MNATKLLDRLAESLVVTAARRWPAELADEMTREWLAELAALRHERRRWRSLTFAGSLALSPAVEAAGEEPMTWQKRLTTRGHALAVPVALTLLAGALFNAVHLTQDHLGPTAAGAALCLATTVMLLLGRHAPIGRVILLGAALYGFLLAGNQEAVMPFMGWMDITPAVATWTALTAATVLISSRLRATGRGVAGSLTAVAGALLTLEVATAAGSLHAAATLGVGAQSAPLWFPLALLPGGTSDFGAYFADGTASFGSLQQLGPAFHASDILLGNASAMAGPLALCSAYVTAGILHRPTPTPAQRKPHLLSRARRMQGVVGRVRRMQGVVGWVLRACRDDRPGPDPRIPVGVAAALGGLAICEALRHAGTATDAMLHRLVDNSAVFGFGFLAHPAGRIAVALLTGLLAVHFATLRHSTRTTTPM